MHIHCPECDFSREVNESQIPADSFFATCPKCGTRFRFRGEEPFEQQADHTVAGPESGSAPDNAPPTQAMPPSGPDEDLDIWARMEKMNDKWENQAGNADADEQEAEPSSCGQDKGPGYSQPSGRQGEYERREEAHRAYQKASAQNGRVPLYSPGGSVPWECKGGFMRFRGFAVTVVLAIKEARRFFAGVNPFSSIVPAWAYMMLCYIPTFLMMSMYYKNLIPMVSGEQGEAAFNFVGYVGFMLNSIFLFTFFQFIGSLFVYFTLRITQPQKAAFRLAFKVVAYAQTAMLLMAVPIVGGIAGPALFVFLLVVGVRNAFRLEPRQAAVAVLPFLIFLGFIMVQSFRLALSLMQNMPM